MWRSFARLLTWFLGPVKFWVVVPDVNSNITCCTVVASRMAPPDCTWFSGTAGGHVTQEFAQYVADGMNAELHKRPPGGRP